MALRLFTYPGDFRAFKVLIAAQYNGVEIDVPDFKVGVDNKTEEFLAKSPLGQVPVLETEQGCLFESNAIARYVARFRRDVELCGRTFFDTAAVDSWVDFCTNMLDVATQLWVMPILQKTEQKPQLTEKAKQDMRKALEVLNKHLTLKTFLVGERITLADIVVVSTLFYPMKMVLDKSFRSAFPNVERWFMTCVNQPQFKVVVGEITLCEKMLVAAKPGGKKQQKKQKKAAPAKKKEEKPAAVAAPAMPKKVKNPLDSLPPSSMVLDAWKRCYSNSKHDYYASMVKFWEMVDLEGYSIWEGMYKYNEDNTVGFMTSNLVGGFIQRSDAVRKYSFGTLAIVGDAEHKPYQIRVCWMIRGQDIKPLLECNPDAEYYEWTKLDCTKEENKKTVADLWCAMEEIDGIALFDSKVFK
jgi:elongation factor 1-gamma